MKERIETMTQILECCTRPTAEAIIMQETSQNCTQLKTYLDFLLSQELIAHNSEKYVTTQKGRAFLEAINQLKNALETYTRNISNEATQILNKKEKV